MATQRSKVKADRRERASVNGVRREVYYPSSDGKPMGESDLHRDEMCRLIYTLEDFYADQADAYVSGNLFLYYVEGGPRKVVSPDVFVAFGIVKYKRDLYKLWEEMAGPALVIEVTSKTTRREDHGKKRALYAQLGVREYYLYDPRFVGLQYLDPPLQGLRLVDGEYRPITPAGDTSLRSDVLPLRLLLVDGRLRFFSNGEPLLSPAERTHAAERRAVEEARRADAKAAACHTAERRIAELEALLRERARRDHAWARVEWPVRAYRDSGGRHDRGGSHRRSVSRRHPRRPRGLAQRRAGA